VRALLGARKRRTSGLYLEPAEKDKRALLEPAETQSWALRAVAVARLQCVGDWSLCGFYGKVGQDSCGVPGESPGPELRI
jgi:hypothetical protein